MQKSINDIFAEDSSFASVQNELGEETLVCKVTQYEDNGRCVDYVIYHGKLEDLITVSFSEDPNSSEARKPITYTFKMISVTKSEIKFQFYFDDPLLIVPSDKISFDLNFGNFEKGMPLTS